jgi:hypothetical protein
MVAARKEPSQGAIQFITPARHGMAAMIFVIIDCGAEGFKEATGVFHANDLRNFRQRAGRRIIDLGFLVADAEPETGVRGRALRGCFREKFIVPPKSPSTTFIFPH